MTLRGVVIGCGFFAQNHLHAWRELDGVEIVATCDVDSGKAEEAARLFGIRRSYTDAGELLGNEKPDFVDIVTTLPSHRPLVELAARHGVAVICQKPFAANLADAEAMVAMCRDAGVPLMVHENFRWQTPLMAVRRAIDSGRIGAPFFGRVSFRHDWDVYSRQPYLAEDPRLAIMDVGIHLLDVARFLFGEVSRISCTAQRVNPRVKGEDVATMLVEHTSGATSIVDCSFFTHLDPNPFPQTLVEVDGDAGSIRLAEGYRMTVAAKGRAETEIVDAPLHPWTERPWHVVRDSVVNIQRHWVERLGSGQTPDTSGADNLQVLRLAMAAYDSAEKRCTVTMN
jgi:predicted dehydrogenase